MKNIITNLWSEIITKTMFIISDAVYTGMSLLITLCVYLLCSLWWENSRGSEFSARSTKLSFSDDSSERLWLATAFLSSTESTVIGYNAQHCRNGATWADLNLIPQSTLFIYFHFIINRRYMFNLFVHGKFLSNLVAFLLQVPVATRSAYGWLNDN